MNKFTKKDFSILLANAIDHFDTSIYGFLAPILAPLFFPHHDPVISLIMSYSIFATSIVTRPLGSYLFGMIALNKGPMKALIYSLIGVSITTGIIGLLPLYSQYGILSPILLIFFRSFRGIFAAGESAIAKLYIIEDKTEKLAIRSSYIYQTSSMLGIVMAGLVSTVVFEVVQNPSEYIFYLTEKTSPSDEKYIIEFLNNNFWRICYLLGSIVGLFALILRKYDDSNIFTNERSSDHPEQLAQDSDKGTFNRFRSWFRIINKSKIKILTITFVFGFSHITYYTAFTLSNSFIPLISKHETVDMMNINNKLLIIDLLLLPVIGVISERFSSNLVMSVSSFILGISIIPLWYFLQDASYEYIFFFRGWIVFWGVMFACPFNLWCFRQVTGNSKYLIIGISSSLGSCVIGKMNVAICLSLYKYWGDSFADILNSIKNSAINYFLGWIDIVILKNIVFHQYMIVSFYLALIMLITSYLVFRSK